MRNGRKDDTDETSREGPLILRKGDPKIAAEQVERKKTDGLEMHVQCM